MDDVGPFEVTAGGGEAVLELLLPDDAEERAEEVAADGVVVSSHLWKMGACSDPAERPMASTIHLSP